MGGKRRSFTYAFLSLLSKTRLDVGEEISDKHGSRRRCKNRFANLGSPRTTRRSRRRVDQEIREDIDKYLIICADDLVVVANNKVKKRRHSGRSKKEKSISIPSPKGNDGDYGYNFDQIGLMINYLIMWNDVIITLVRIRITLFPVFLFCCNWNDIESKREVKFKEENILRAARVVLPAANFAISKARDLFSGEPSMSLKVAPLLLLGQIQQNPNKNGFSPRSLLKSVRKCKLKPFANFQKGVIAGFDCDLAKMIIYDATIVARYPKRERDLARLVPMFLVFLEVEAQAKASVDVEVKTKCASRAVGERQMKLTEHAGPSLLGQSRGKRRGSKRNHRIEVVHRVISSLTASFEDLATFEKDYEEVGAEV
ncbi:hypothetical protein L6452_30664 [Arctium lappa]|uniref:Uncharacterized protein n=1 Tax=Arctium lappa TaxID=4217 RepID=A0ACB8ZJR1_ARCLA|nr:hypothetical protein L6452_30664 [Arctium lappa]